MAFPEWLAGIVARRWERRHRLTVVGAIGALPDGRLVPLVRVRNAGNVGVWIDAIGGEQGGHVFVIPDHRLPVHLEADGPWLEFPVMLDQHFRPQEPWVAIVREPSGREHRSA